MVVHGKKGNIGGFVAQLVRSLHKNHRIHPELNEMGLGGTIPAIEAESESQDYTH